MMISVNERVLVSCQNAGNLMKIEHIISGIRLHLFRMRFVRMSIVKRFNVGLKKVSSNAIRLLLIM